MNRIKKSFDGRHLKIKNASSRGVFIIYQGIKF